MLCSSIRFKDESLEALGHFSSFGLSYIENDILLSINIEGDLLIQTPGFNSYNFIDSLGIISYLDDSNTNYIVEGLNYYKPSQFSFGISYNPQNNSDLTISSELQYNQYNQFSYFQDSYIYKFGVEYFKKVVVITPDELKKHKEYLKKKLKKNIY